MAACDTVIHSFHLIDMPARVSARTLLWPPDRTTVGGLQHAECLVLMRFGAPIGGVRVKSDSITTQLRH